MAIERTFSILKPDATKRNLTGEIGDLPVDDGLAHARAGLDSLDAHVGKTRSSAN